jgi:hypothetical protein
MDDWFPPRYFDTLEDAHKDRFRYGSGASTLYEWQSGQWVKRQWCDDLAPNAAPTKALRK